MQVVPTTLEIIKENREFTVAVLPPHGVDNVWNWLRLKLEEHPDLWNQSHTLESLYESIKSGQIRVWLVVKDGLIYMSFFTTITVYPVRSTLDVVWASGKDLEKYLGIGLAGLDTFARNHGCSDILVSAAREGWGKPLAPFGYKKTMTVFSRHVSNERLN